VEDKHHPERTPNARSGIGQSLLNRFVYRVDAQKGEFVVVRRANEAKAK
jgi:hypothetical protein